MKMVSDKAERALETFRKIVLRDLVEDSKFQVLEELCGGWGDSTDRLGGKATLRKLAERLGSDSAAAHLIAHLFCLYIEKGLIELKFDDVEVKKPRLALNEGGAFYFGDEEGRVWDKIEFVVKP